MITVPRFIFNVDLAEDKMMAQDDPMCNNSLCLGQDNKPVCAVTLQTLRLTCGNTDWTYAMRRTMQEVVPGLYLGPYSSAQKAKLDVLKQHGITHIVCVRQDVEAYFIKPNFPDEITYLTLNIADSVTENIIQHFPVVKRFIDDSFANGGKVLIHGNGGISRSAALAIAYIMEKYGLTIKDAFTLVQQNRFCINPNEGFMAQLAEFEPIYKAQRTMQQGQSSGDCIRNKRSLDR